MKHEPWKRIRLAILLNYDDGIEHVHPLAQHKTRTSKCVRLLLCVCMKMISMTMERMS